MPSKNLVEITSRISRSLKNVSVTRKLKMGYVTPQVNNLTGGMQWKNIYYIIVLMKLKKTNPN